ncbi:MAG TPA: AraC family transcriptional regulator [Puia sp.]|jgi:AraC-like DNA-binding protein|nr:AraC family transcriptional regulator [Puia sp.]
MLNVYDFLQSQGEDYKKLSFKDLLFVHYRCPQQERHASFYSHLNYFLYVKEGRKTFYHSDRTYPLNEGTCAFVRKGGYMQERFFDSDWVLMAFFVPDSYLQDFVADFRHSLPVRPLRLPLDEQLLYLHVNPLTSAFFDSMVPYFFGKPAVSEQLVEMKFREMVFQLLADPENQLLLSYLASMNERQHSLRELMEANFRCNLSLEEFARIANRSLSAFKRDFIVTYQQPPGKWLLKRRLEHAEELLSRGTKPVADIADECGFESQTHFNRVFKERFRIAPLQYRAQKRSIEPQR